MGDSGQAAKFSVDTCVGDWSSLLAGFDVRDWIVERCGTEAGVMCSGVACARSFSF